MRINDSIQSLAQEKCIVRLYGCLACLLCKGAERPVSSCIRVTFSLSKYEDISVRE